MSLEKQADAYSSSENELSNTGFLRWAGQHCHENKPCSDQDLLDKIYRTQRQTHKALNYNIQASHTLANGMGRVELLLQQLVDIQMSNLRPTSCQSGHEAPVTHPSLAANEEQDLEYVC